MSGLLSSSPRVMSDAATAPSPIAPMSGLLSLSVMIMTHRSDEWAVVIITHRSDEWAVVIITRRSDEWAVVIITHRSDEWAIVIITHRSDERALVIITHRSDEWALVIITHYHSLSVMSDAAALGGAVTVHGAEPCAIRGAIRRNWMQ